jgi:hypothetical protein
MAKRTKRSEIEQESISEIIHQTGILHKIERNEPDDSITIHVVFLTITATILFGIIEYVVSSHILNKDFEWTNIYDPNLQDYLIRVIKTGVSFAPLVFVTVKYNESKLIQVVSSIVGTLSGCYAFWIVYKAPSYLYMEALPGAVVLWVFMNFELPLLNVIVMLIAVLLYYLLGIQ